MGPHTAITCPNCGHGLTMYRNPVPTVDIIIGYEGGIVLVLRKNPPPAGPCPAASWTTRDRGAAALGRPWRRRHGSPT
jgi:hypothetical protein